MKWRLDDGQIEVPDDETVAVLRTKTPGERFLMVGEMWRFARFWITAAVRSQHLEWLEDAVQAEVSRRLSGGAT